MDNDGKAELLVGAGPDENAPALIRVYDLDGNTLTMIDRRTSLTDQMVDEIRQAYKTRMLAIEIPVNVRLAEAPGYGLTILQYESWSPARARGRSTHRWYGLPLGNGTPMAWRRMG